MLHRLLSTVILLVVCIAVNAQGTCIISGNIADCRLSDGKKIKNVYLTRVGDAGRQVKVATAKVSKGKYTLKYELAQDEPVLLYSITGFGDGVGIELFVEPGEVTVTTESALNPNESFVSGTPSNDTYAEYKAILSNREHEVARMIASLEEEKGKVWVESAEGQSTIKRMVAKEKIKTESMLLRFFIDHNESPMTPLEVERVLLPKLSATYAEQMTKAISSSLHNHPYYHSFRNKVLASNMKVGNEVPDIALPLLNGNVKHLTDFRGKYVVLNFWANGCNKSKEMFGELQNLYDVIKEKNNEIVIISFALESDAMAWESGIKTNNADHDGWIHACDILGTESPAAKMFAVEKTPKIVLIEPEGLAVSLDMDIDELVIRVEQIMSGDLYYLDQEK
ncbi:MAG: redoxin domain-containing protein [Bacteroidaceae bacterium]|nr:redoxin domain-containing protein [Bacteroidaceae bacterium]